MRWTRDDATIHLTYCTNVHPAETLEEVRRGLEEVTVPLRQRMGAEGPFGVGLYLSARAVEGENISKADIAASQVYHSVFIFQADGKYMVLMPAGGNSFKGEGAEVGITAKQANGFSRVCFGGGNNYRCISWKGRSWGP